MEQISGSWLLKIKFIFFFDVIQPLVSYQEPVFKNKLQLHILLQLKSLTFTCHSLAEILRKYSSCILTKNAQNKKL